MVKRLSAGDVLEVRVGGRFAYLQYIGRHRELGDAVLVNPQLREEPAVISEGYFSGGYVTFYPATAAVAGGLVDVVAHLPPCKLPDRVRRAGQRSAGRVNTWIIEEGANEVIKNTLSDEDLRLPIAAIWNHEFLVHRIAEGWSPAKEGAV